MSSTFSPLESTTGLLPSLYPLADPPTTPSLTSSQLSFYGAPARVEEVSTDPRNNDRSTVDTLRIMAQLSHASTRDPILIDITHQLVDRLPDPQDQLRAIFGWIKQHLELVEDEVMLAEIWGKPPDNELLISPSVIARMEHAKGDCDDFSMLAASMLMIAGFPVWFAVVADGSDVGGDTTKLTHVYVETVRDLGTFELVPFDASYGSYVGWEYQDYTRKERVFVG